MSARFNLVLSDSLNNAIEQVVVDRDINKSDIIRKALEIYLASIEASSRGLKLGFFDPKTEQVKTEIVGL
ncbi:metal-responsive CopG/Arc/MetJ family transcriptional regulator [Oxalobacteraceae bacterium GrIS 2.11]